MSATNYQLDHEPDTCPCCYEPTIVGVAVITEEGEADGYKCENGCDLSELCD